MALVLLVVGLVSLAGLIVSISRQREMASARRLVLGRGISLLEEIKGAPPETLVVTYHGATRTVAGVMGSNVDLSALTVNVDASNPNLLVVVVTGSWVISGATDTMALRTEIYNPSG